MKIMLTFNNPTTGILLNLSASKNNTFRTSTRRKKNAVVLYPFWFIQVEVLAYYYA